MWRLFFWSVWIQSGKFRVIRRRPVPRHPRIKSEMTILIVP